MAKKLLRHRTFKTDLVFGLACFDYGVLFKLPKTVAVDCYHHVLHNCNSRGWVARGLRDVRMVDYAEFVDDIRQVYLDQLGVGPAVEEMTSFLSACHELPRKKYTWNLFKLCSYCFSHDAPKLPMFRLG